MLVAIADTHAVIWYLYDDPRLSVLARERIETARQARDRVGLSSVTLAEIVYLSEKGRIVADALQRLLTALDQPGAVLVELPFNRGVAEMMPLIGRSQIPDLPDRIIAATAQLFQVPVISRDKQIRLSSIPTIW